MSRSGAWSPVTTASGTGGFRTSSPCICAGLLMTLGVLEPPATTFLFVPVLARPPRPTSPFRPVRKSCLASWADLKRGVGDASPSSLPSMPNSLSVPDARWGTQGVVCPGEGQRKGSEVKKDCRQNTSQQTCLEAESRAAAPGPGGPVLYTPRVLGRAAGASGDTVWPGLGGGGVWGEQGSPDEQS